MRSGLNSILVGIVLAVGILLFGDLAQELVDDPGWSAAVHLGLGILVAMGASLSQSAPLAPLIAGLLVAWPVTAEMVAAVPRVPESVPLLSGPLEMEISTAMVVIGVLLFAAARGTGVIVRTGS